MNIVGLWPNLFRAIEVAKVSDMSVSVWFKDDYKKNCIDDYALIKQYCSGWFDNFVANGDINVTISKPSKYTKEGDFESLNDISARIESYKHETPTYKSNVALNLLDAAASKLDLSMQQISKVKKIAMHISTMDNSDILESYHVAEAISYVWVDEGLTNTETCHVTFGGINIQICEQMSQDDITSAIKYLTDMTV